MKNLFSKKTAAFTLTAILLAVNVGFATFKNRNVKMGDSNLAPEFNTKKVDSRNFGESTDGIYAVAESVVQLTEAEVTQIHDPMIVVVTSVEGWAASANNTTDISLSNLD